jgi:hypothetical protein
MGCTFNELWLQGVPESLLRIGLHHWLTPWKPPVVHLLKNVSIFYVTWRFNIPLTRTLDRSLSRDRRSQSIQSHLISLMSVLILSCLCLGLPSGLFPCGFPTILLYACLLFPMPDVCPAYLILLGQIILNISGEEYKSWSSSLRSVLRSCIYALKGDRNENEYTVWCW